MAANGHRRALANNLAPDTRVDMLSAFTWRVVPMSGDVILPDCVALGADASGAMHPLMLLGFDEVQTVYLPLTSRTLLVGTRGQKVDVTAMEFNTNAAACSHSYFLSATRSPSLDALAGSIGVRSVSIVEQSVSNGVRDWTQEGQITKATYDTLTERPIADSRPAPFKTTPSFGVTYHGDFAPDLINEINEALGSLAGAAAWTVPLERLDAITIDDNYPESLSNLDRGIPGLAPPQSTQNEVGNGIAQAPLVMRNGILKSHIVIHGGIARNLLSDNEETRKYAIFVFLHQFADAGVLQVIDESLPGILLNHRLEGLDRDLQSCSYPAWNSYFTYRAMGSYYDGQLAIQKEILLTALRATIDHIALAKAAYLKSRDLQDLMPVAYSKVAFILEHAAGLLGVADSCEIKPLEDCDELRAELQQQGLLDWFHDFHLDLVSLWDRRGNWGSYEEFMELNRHAERLLWPYGILPWITPEGIYRVEVSPEMLIGKSLLN